MTVRAVEGKKPYTGGKAIDIDENKVISLRLRDENNLIIWDEGDNEIYVDLQLDDEIRPTDAFPVGVTTGRVIVDNGWDATGTIICAKTTSGDNIKLFYADNGKLYIDNGTGTFKQIYFKGDVDAIASALQNQIDTIMGLGKFLSIWNCATGLPTTFPLDLPYEYTTGDWYLVGVVDNTTNYKPNGSQFTGVASTTIDTDAPVINDVYIYDGTTWMRQVNSGVGGGVTFAQIIGQPTDNQNLATALGNKQDSLTLPSTPTQGNLVTWGADNETLVDGGTVPTGVPSGGTDGQVLSKVSGSVAWANAPDSSNTKTFYLSSTSDLTNAQAAYDWYKAGNNPIIRYDNIAYILQSKNSSPNLFFISHSRKVSDNHHTYMNISEIKLNISLNTVTSITVSDNQLDYLDTGVNYPVPYTPAYNGSPATKKYVDDRAVPTSGTTGYVLTKTASGYEWSAPSGGDVMVSSQSGNILTSGMKIWAGTEADYGNLGTYDNNTVYLTI